jgi:hypothetical protein
MSKAAKILAIILITFGGVFTLVGVSSYLTVGNVLTAQAITVADDASCLAGATVNNPLAAWCQQDIINDHALHATNGLSYAQMDREDPLREVAMNGSVLRASLFTSVIAFALSALVAVLGVLFALVGVTFLVYKPKA